MRSQPSSRLIQLLVDDAEDDRQQARLDTEEPEDGHTAKNGDYHMGEFDAFGLTFVLETSRGEYRQGHDAGGKPWKVKMPVDYGYFDKTDGIDGDEVDVFVGPNLEGDGKIFVLYQVDAETGEFDEHKILFGFDNRSEAVAAYDQSFSDGRAWERRDKVEEISLDDLKQRLRTGEFESHPDAPLKEATMDVLTRKQAATYLAISNLGLEDLAYARLHFPVVKRHGKMWHPTGAQLELGWYQVKLGQDSEEHADLIEDEVKFFESNLGDWVGILAKEGYHVAG